MTDLKQDEGTYMLCLCKMVGNIPSICNMLGCRQQLHGRASTVYSFLGLSDAFYAIFGLHVVLRHVLYMLHLVRKAAHMHHSDRHDTRYRILFMVLQETAWCA